MLKKSEILDFIEQDKSDERKRQAREGERYYEGEHDIKNYKLYYYNGDGELTEDKTRSNIKISHPFFTELVDQQVQYMLSGKEGFAFSDNTELQKILDEYFNNNEDFKAELFDVVTDTISKGSGYLYVYKNKYDKLTFQSANSLGVIEVRANDTDDKCEYVIYWYIDRIEKGRKKIKRIQVWNDKETWYYVQEEDGNLIKDKDAEFNPRPHTIYGVGDEHLYQESFGFIPFFRLDNNKKRLSDLHRIKALIDDYDLMSCGLSNNLQDIAEGIYVVTGFEGDNLDELIENVKVKKHIGVQEGGSLDIKTINIPYDARKVKLEEDEKNIYRFGMGLDSTRVGDGNITNVVIKSRYSLLDLKSNKLEIRLKQFLRKLIDVVLDEVNEKEGTDYQSKDVRLEFTREIITNASDNAGIELTDAQRKQVEINTILSLAGVLDNDTIVQKICDVLDVDYEEIKDKLPQQEVMELGEDEQMAEAGS